MTLFELLSIGVSLFQCGLIAWGIWVMRGSNENRVATNQLMIAQSKALTDQSKTLADQNKALTDQSKALADQSKALADQSKALADIGAGIREQVELSRAQRAEQSEQSVGIRALLERSQPA